MYQIAKPMMTAKIPQVITALGFNRGLGRAVAALDSIALRSSVVGGAVVGGTSVIVVWAIAGGSARVSGAWWRYRFILIWK
jgi:hypothetical protein